MAKIPKGEDEVMHRLHDETVAESAAMVGSIYKYASGQEKMPPGRQSRPVKLP